ncbi:GNAT family N-acetyltransferase [Methanoculleus sp.]|uniref:GNAT family N-acetyltransferase n=1 Tax=Methanoculleus sp. TaxID=90427 RepID=UPI0025CEFB0C|nr:GNAT family N-acetyltransferase [Methanoculleus sp.]
MTQIEVNELKTDELAAWDELVSNSVQGTVFHTSDWLLKTASSLNQTPVILGCYEDQTLVGGCSLLLSNPYKLLKIASSAALFAPYGGVVVTDIESTKRRERELHTDNIITSIRNYIARERFDHVNLVNSPGFQDIRGFTRNGWDARVYYTYMLPVHENIFDHISKNARRSIRKAQKLGVTATEHFDPEIYWKLCVNTFQKQNSRPPFTKRHLMNMLEMIQKKDLGEMWVARTSSGEVAAAEVIVYDSKTAHRWSAASSEEHLNTGATSLLLGEVIAHLVDRNYPSINLMAGNVVHLSAFIASFNPDLIPYYGVEQSRARYSIMSRLSNRIPGVGRRSGRPLREGLDRR